VARNAVGTGQVFFLRGDDEVARLLLQVGGAVGVGFRARCCRSPGRR